MASDILVNIGLGGLFSAKPLPEPMLSYCQFEPPGYSYHSIHDLSFKKMHVDGLVQDCNNSIANALELLQSCT